jgi:hypothetical protein
MRDVLQPFRDLLAGGRAGLVATAAMSLLMLAAQRAGLTGTLPPRKVADWAARQMPTSDRPHGEDRQALAGLSHFFFGASAGALYGLATSGLRRIWISAAPGVLYATGVYLVSYLGWMPALNIMPSASDDRAGRVATMLAGHWVYGALLGVLLAIGRRRQRVQQQVKRRFAV